jgi:PAS domain S-box-containing protein
MKKARKSRATSKPPRRAAKKSGAAANRSTGSGKRLLIGEQEMRRLQESLREAQDTLDAIRNGEVDAVVVSGSHGKQVYSLAGAEQPYRVYVEQMQEGAVTVAEDGLILYSNQRFASMTGQPLERVISARIQNFIPETAWNRIREVFTTDEAVKHECAIGEGAGNLPVNLTASRLPVDGQAILCLVVTDLTSLLESKKLRQAKEGAEKANEAKDAFLAALSHELRTPLTPALMATMALENDATLPDAARQTLGMIRRNVELEARLIDDLLDLTRIARGKLELHLKPIDVHEVIRSALDICMPDLEQKRQHLTLDMQAGETAAMGDAVRLQQALWNVIRNAVKFTPDHGSIRIHTENDSETGNIAVSVSDTGAGFDAAAAPGLFKAFEQGSREITRRFGGLGLGLAISRSIVEAHGGWIDGRSAGSGKGATFVLELPARRRASRPGSRTGSRNPLAEDEGGLNILMVEDHKDTRTSMEHLLKRARHVVHSVESASQALAAAAGSTFDLVISDLGLPDMSGIDLMRRLRDEFGLQGIAVSGYGMDDDIQRSKEAGFLHHLTKPIRMDQLRRLLQEVQGLR